MVIEPRCEKFMIINVTARPQRDHARYRMMIMMMMMINKDDSHNNDTNADDDCHHAPGYVVCYI